MLTPAGIRTCLKGLAETAVFRKGFMYYAQQAVGPLSVSEPNKTQTVRIEASVSGNETYRPFLEFNTDTTKVVNTSCTCPSDGICKHIVALGLAYAHALEPLPSSRTSSQERTLTDEQFARRAWHELGLPVEALSPALLNEILSSRSQPVSDVESSVQKKTSSSTFDPAEYFILLNTSQGYTPILYRKDQSSQQASVNALLTRTDLSADQRALFTFIKRIGAREEQESPALAELFPLLIRSEIPVFKNYYAPYRQQRPLLLMVSSQKIQAEIHFTLDTDGDEVSRFPIFSLRVPEETWRDQPSSVQGNCLLRETTNSIELFVLTPDLANLVHHLKPSGVRTDGHPTFFETAFSEEETTRFEQIARDATRLFSLITPPPDFTNKESVKAEPTFIVDYRPRESFLEIAPVIDYGFYQQPISENVRTKRERSGSVVAHKKGTTASDTYLIHLQEKTIHFAKIDIEKEKEFYRQLSYEAEYIGFTKTLKCVQRGTTVLNFYLQTYWPTFVSYAKDEQIPLRFSHDKLILETADFRADFSTDLNADRDWLYFDLNCYCGDEKLTLEKLTTYLKSGEPFFRREDGTLVTIGNREKLEQLARLLQNFQVQDDGGFVGHLYDAPALEYVMTCSPHYNAIRAKSFQTFLQDAQAGKPVKSVRLPASFATILRPYQKQGVDWLHFLQSYHFGGILADDMGLGKTIQTLALLVMQRVPGKPSLVICPKTLVYNWKMEAEQYAPNLKVLVIEGIQKERRRSYAKASAYDLIILSYNTLKQDEPLLAAQDQTFNYVILDEAQFIKNHATKSAQAVKKLKTDYRLALTGTPFENNVSEIWSIFDFVMPGFLGTYDQFFKHYQKPIMDDADRAVLEQLRQKIQPFMLRRTKSEVLKELPAKIEQISACGLSDAQNILYQEILAQVRGEVLQHVEREGFKRSQIHILAALTKLRQACNHPALLTKNVDWRAYESTKLDSCLELIQEAIAGNHKVLIFSQFTSMLDIVSESLKDHVIAHHYLSGRTKNRQQMVDSFNEDPTIPVFLISLKAGGTGLNLTAADTVIIFDPWWNPSVENQAVDRAHRIGQDHTVNVYRLLTLGTIEEKIQALKQKKQALFNAMIGESQDLFKKLSWEDVKELFA